MNEIHDKSLGHNSGIYMLAIELGNYRAAAWFALRECRRLARTDASPGLVRDWKTRLTGAFARRNRRAR
jgi:hypothetical protein